MVDDNDKKRKWRDHGAKRRRHDRNKFRRITNTNPQKKDLTAGLSGILISCAPRHERDAFRDAALLFGRFLDDANIKPALPAAPVSPAAPAPTSAPEGNSASEVSLKSTVPNGSNGADKVAMKEPEPSMGAEQNQQSNAESSSPPIDCRRDEADAIDEVDAELSELRNPQTRPFSQIDAGSNGAVFMRVHVPEVDLERLVEVALREARASGSSGARRCFRVVPIHTTCYAKQEDVTEAAISVVRKHFPPAIPEGDIGVNADDKSNNDIKKKATTYAIAFRSRSNNGAHRDQYIPAIASAIEKEEPRYKVNLTTPDVTLIVEIVKTVCYIGTFRHYFQLARMNLQEAACPSKPNVSKQAHASSEGINPEKPEGDGNNELKPPVFKDTEEDSKQPGDVTPDNAQSSKNAEGEKSSNAQEDSGVVADKQIRMTVGRKIVGKEVGVRSAKPADAEVTGNTEVSQAEADEHRDLGDAAVVEDAEK